jgi:hypothetical protein
VRRLAFAALVLATACSPAPPPKPPPPRPEATPPPAAPVLRPFLRGCLFAGASFVEGASFLHVAHLPPGPLRPDSFLQPTYAVRVSPDGGVDLAAKVRGNAVYGRFPGAAWLRADPMPETWVGRWDGARWAPSEPPERARVSWVPWREGGVVRVEADPMGGVALRLEGTGGPPPGVEAPPELARLVVRRVASLPEQGVILFSGSMANRPSEGHVVVAGPQRASFANAAGPADFALSPRADRVLVAHRVAAAGGGGPNVRAVRVVGGRVGGGERLPAEGRLAIDERGVEWLLALDGALFRHDPGSPRWDAVDEPEGVEAAQPSALQPFGDEVWFARGERLYRYANGAVAKVDLPAGLEPGPRAFSLHADREGRLWVAAQPVGGFRSDLLTTGPAPRELRCDEVAPPATAGR